MIAAQRFISGCHAGGAVIQVADAQIFAAEGDHRAGTETKALRTKNGGFDDIQSGFSVRHLSVSRILWRRTVAHTSACWASASPSSRGTRVFDRGERTGMPVPPSYPEMVMKSA